jgi:hypothetical protein
VVQISTTLPAPPPNPGFSGPTAVTYTFGRTTADIRGSQSPGESPAPAGSSGPVGSSDTSSGSPSSAGPSQGSFVPGVATSGSVGNSGIVRSPSSGGAVALAPTPRRRQVALRPSASESPYGSAWPFYLVFVAVALAVTFGSQLVRLLGVLAPWKW